MIPRQTNQKENQMIFELDNGKQLVGKACHGDTLYDVVVTNNLEIDGFGACEGTLACSTLPAAMSDARDK
ncbi:hypothetical protein QR98_0068480 [Sarcoptes scabiei]|uniref:Uncharacterized protein n=1 Tax=Sarcoptes scabiei TaxID=52283 RepID=A0A132ABH5_SARSC|nr:hypothetical protein QR98_0068480 [Sarcoptes scabiei]